MADDLRRSKWQLAIGNQPRKSTPFWLDEIKTGSREFCE
jgi:hypothetical protein